MTGQLTQTYIFIYTYKNASIMYTCINTLFDGLCNDICTRIIAEILKGLRETKTMFNLPLSMGHL